MVRLNPPTFIVLNREPKDERVSDLAPMPTGAIVFLVVIVAIAISAALIGKFSARRPLHAPISASPAPVASVGWCWSTVDPDHCAKH
jgi:hypothetical protein